MCVCLRVRVCVCVHACLCVCVCDDNNKTTALFTTRGGGTRAYTVPVVTMTQVLRNSKQIVDTLHSVRDTQMNECKLNTSAALQSMESGHYITSTKVLHHVLQQGTDEKHCVPFVCERLEQMLKDLSLSPTPFNYSSVAILFYWNSDVSKYKAPIEQLLRQHYNIGVQSIEEQIITNNNTDVVLDCSDNIQSFESPVVVYVRTSGYGVADLSPYNIISRARTTCVVIDVGVDVRDTPLHIEHADRVLWHCDNGNFNTL